MNTIKLTDGFTIIYKETNVLLRLETIREKENVDTLELEKYTHRDTWYFLSLAQALRKYTSLCLMPCVNIEALTVKVEELEKLVNSIKM